MTLSETKKKWKISEKRLFEWIDNGFIPEIEVQNEKISIGTTKPFVPDRGTNITVENVGRYILKACNNLEYVDCNIFCIKPEQFREILLKLKENGYIYKNIPDENYQSNRNFMITEKGMNSLKKRKLELDKLSFTFKFKYLDMNAEIERGKL